MDSSADPSPSTADLLTDAQIARLSLAQRLELVARLRPDRVRPRPHKVRVARGLRLWLMVGGSIAMIPWLVYLGFTLPQDYNANHWALVWIGFDIFLVAMMAATAYLGWRRRVLVILPAFGTGVLLLVDAWFDTTTAGPDEIRVSIATAALAEVPLAVVLLTGALALFRYLVLANPLHDPAGSPWRARVPF
ncbi:hypothetical protein IRT45_13150 [Nocardia sp. BSTN01]|uniref:hypothetical protein n=1 Tax=Nocardia sp. BSTN01 TaxID=2783665 RepID=UPI0018909D48|nr:hypothetical protein [Nocardia sp. BSTN01]MBF4998099.1 hypothetical protein [Nocardia sp. BSTN01]